MRSIWVAGLLVLAAAGCAPARDGCGVLACVSSPHLRARGAGLMGAPVGQALAVMGGAPTGVLRFDGADTAHATGSAEPIDVMTWTRSQNDPSTGFLTCTETLAVQGGVVRDYMRRGNCG